MNVSAKSLFLWIAVFPGALLALAIVQILLGRIGITFVQMLVDIGMWEFKTFVLTPFMVFSFMASAYGLAPRRKGWVALIALLLVLIWAGNFLVNNQSGFFWVSMMGVMGGVSGLLTLGLLLRLNEAENQSPG